ncbi:sensor domain-containing diguanylate cyclase [Pseudocolwellia agarivorans]|uniref:sensor domain-containing diguanylate cyclase n=1 Tax=Pseudocolwellia agarivorans TaxID=1911682 RepID=UPI0009841C3B|nr:sensor domain-containing diguanylate cyclase [Pseudocolwellia agarivorans]
MSTLPNKKIEKILVEALLLTKDGVGLFDLGDRLIFCNDLFGELFGLSASEALNKTFTELCFGCFNTNKGANIEADDFETWISNALLKRRSSNYRTFETDTVEGKHFIVTEQIAQEDFLYVYITDITEKKKNELRLKLMSQELEELATTDYLTGIRNRRYFYQMARAEFNRSKRKSTTLSLLILDLDKFKLINDNYGHKAGDIILQTVTQTISKLLRNYDIFARIGGEEFAILLPSTDAKLAYIIAERVRKSVELIEVTFEDTILTITTSIGMVESSEEITSFDQLVQTADKYLNQVKKQGRNKVLFS